MKSLLVALLLISLATSARAAEEDYVILKTGRTLRGKILQTGKTVIRIETASGAEWIRRTEIDALHRAPRPTVDSPPKRPPAPRRATPPAPAPAKPATGETAKGETAVPEPTKASVERLAKIVTELQSPKRATRVKAAAWVVARWPTSARALDSALRSKSEVARIEAVRLLGHERLGDASGRLRIGLADVSPRVRATALRVVRHGAYASLESRVIDLMCNDAEWVVRQEAIRALEEIGTRECLQPVLSAWSLEDDKDRKRRYRRVLRALLEEDFGDDVEAWRTATAEVSIGRRSLRGD